MVLYFCTNLSCELGTGSEARNYSKNNYYSFLKENQMPPHLTPHSRHAESCQLLHWEVNAHKPRHEIRPVTVNAEVVLAPWQRDTLLSLKQLGQHGGQDPSAHLCPSLGFHSHHWLRPHRAPHPASSVAQHPKLCTFPSTGKSPVRCLHPLSFPGW